MSQTQTADGSEASDATNNNDTILDEQLTRRRALQTGAAAGTMAIIGTTGVSAQEDLPAEIGVDYDASLTHEGRLEATVEVADLDLSEMERGEYVDDDGNIASLGDAGWTERTRADEDEDTDPTPHNPDSYNPGNLIYEDELAASPRGVTYTNADDEEVGVSFLDADQWASVSGSMSLANVDTHSLQITGSSASGASVSFDESDFEIGSGEGRKVLQLIFDVDAAASGDLVELEIVHSGSSTPTVALLDGDGDASATGTVATSTGYGYVAQIELSELATDWDTISDIKLSVDGSPDVTISGLNLDSSSKWALGDREYLNSDDEIETETIESNDGGSISITSIETLGDRLSSATIEGVSMELEQWSRDLPAESKLNYKDESPSAYSREMRLTLGLVHEMQSAYDLDWSSPELYLIGGLPSGRYVSVGYQTNISETPESQQDVLDESLIDQSSSISIGAEEELSMTTSVLSGEMSLVVADIVVTEQELEELAQGPSFGGGGGSTGGGGLFSSVRSQILAIAAVVGGWLGYRNLGE